MRHRDLGRRRIGFGAGAVCCEIRRGCGVVRSLQVDQRLVGLLVPELHLRLTCQQVGVRLGDLVG
jgi:hypothetical protein